MPARTDFNEEIPYILAEKHHLAAKAAVSSVFGARTDAKRGGRKLAKRNRGVR